MADTANDMRLYNCQAAVSPLFASAEAQLEKELAQQTLEDVIDNLYKDAKQKRN